MIGFIIGLLAGVLLTATKVIFGAEGVTFLLQFAALSAFLKIICSEKER